MRRLSSLLCLVGLAAAQQDADGRVRVLLEAPSRAWQGQVLELGVRIELQQPWFSEHAVPLFQQELDLPLAVGLGWSALAARLGAMKTKVPASGLRAVIDGEVELLQDGGVVERAETRWQVYRYAAAYVCAGPGPLTLPAAQVQFAWAAEFVDDIVQGRMPVDRHVVTVRGEALPMEIVALPTEGRPEEFTGAVGRFSIEAAVSPAEARIGDQVELTVTIRGEGNLAAVEPPIVPVGQGLHVLGVIESRSSDALRATYDLELVDERAQVVPPLRLVAFDPERGSYHTRTSQPLPLRILAGGKQRTLPEAGPGPKVTSTAQEGSWGDVAIEALWWIVVLSLVVVVALRRRPNAGAAGAPAAERAAKDPRARLEQFAAAIDTRPQELATIFDDLLVDVTGVSLDRAERAVLEQHLQAAGCPAELALRVVRQRESLHSGRYAGISHGAAMAALHVCEELAAATAKAPPA